MTQMTGKKNRIGNILIIFGVIMLTTAAAIVVYNNILSGNAADVSADVVQKINEQIQSQSDQIYVQDSHYHDYSSVLHKKENCSQSEMKISIDGEEFEAVLRIPSENIELPVKSSLDMKSLKKYPCIYSGSISKDNIIIAAHNYKSHFGNIKYLSQGDEVYLTDVNGNEIRYAVSEIELIDGSGCDEMKTGKWDLTLFTCTLSGQKRVTVRCLQA